MMKPKLFKSEVKALSHFLISDPSRSYRNNIEISGIYIIIVIVSTMPSFFSFITFFLVCVSRTLSQTSICGTCNNGGAPPMDNTLLQLQCSDSNAVINAIQFASYGTPTGTCGSYKTGTCNAANSTSVVQNLCLNNNQCGIFPNTTTFGDPCFGTAKVLTVQFTCSSETGTANCSVLPPPPSPPLANYTATVTVSSWTNITGTLQIIPSLQVVSQHFLFRDSSIHDTSFDSLQQVSPQYARFVPWIPYPAVGVGALMPPSGTALCGPSNIALGGQTLPITIDCGSAGGGTGGTIASINFASFGRPTGTCGNYAINNQCHASNSSQVVSSLCVGQSSCTIPTAPGNNPFGTPCGGGTYLFVEVQCSNSAVQHTYWNMTLVDNFFTDFWNAVDGNNSNPIPNFSTQPTWLYSPNDYSWPENPDTPWYGYDKGTAPALNLTSLSDYYGRLYAYFKQGQFIDEYGYTVTRPGGPLNLTMIEVFNEVDYEHGHNPQSYTVEFDAVVQGVRKYADPEKTIQFVGLSLPNIDSTGTVVQWAQYFLNASNHSPDVVDALNWIGFHAYPTNGGYSPDPTTFAGLFSYADSFVQKVAAVEQVITALSPTTKIALDETGTDMDGVLDPSLAPPNDNPRYWVAAAGYFAYLFGNLGVSSTYVHQLGASQLMDAPGQEPSVTLLDWSTGLGTSRLWIVKLLKDLTQVGDQLPYTVTNATGGGCNSNDLYAQAYAPYAKDTQLGHRVLLVNKRNAHVTVNATSTCVNNYCSNCNAYVLDEFSGLEPARQVSCLVPGIPGEASLTLAPYGIGILQFTVN